MERFVEIGNTSDEPLTQPPKTMTHASTLITPTAKSCLLGDQAAACFFHLASGESRSRNYRFARGNGGYYYEPRIRKMDHLRQPDGNLLRGDLRHGPRGRTTPD